MSELFHTDSVWCMCPECNGAEPEREPDEDDESAAPTQREGESE